MTARLSPLQRQVLEQLAHIRVAPEDAWLSTARLRQLTGCRTATLARLLNRGLVENAARTEPYKLLGLWRITDKGREALG